MPIRHSGGRFPSSEREPRDKDNPLQFAGLKHTAPPKPPDFDGTTLWELSNHLVTERVRAPALQAPTRVRSSSFYAPGGVASGKVAITRVEGH